MKLSFFFSLLFHFVIGMTLIYFPVKRRPWRIPENVYQVELVSLPAITTPASAVTQNEQAVRINEETDVPDKQEERVAYVPESEINKDKKTKKMSRQTEGSSAEVKVDEDFPFAYYLNLIRRRIQENWNPPFQNTIVKEKLSTVVVFQIERNGNINHVSLENGSGRFLYDQAAQRAVFSVKKLPPLPREFIGNQLTVHIEFESLW